MLKIEFSGVDACGKTTAIKYFVKIARDYGLAVTETREVGNPHLVSCTKMREFVLDPNNKLTGQAMELIFSAMRYENDNWLKNLESDTDFVVSDRGWLDHLAYSDNNISEDFTNSFYYGHMENATQLPDIVIYFNISTETALKRRMKRGDKPDAIELKGVEFQEKVKESFEKHIAIFEQSEHCGRVYDVDANQDIDGVQGQLDDILNNIINSSLFKEQRRE